MELSFSGEVWHWRGPAPFHFVTVPEPEAGEISAVKNLVTYGWGVIPARVQIGATRFTTSLFPKDGGFVVPVKDAVRRAEGIELGDTVAVRLTIEGPR
jgi:hypothetical protein